jgi:hypothetical protein
MSAMDSAEYECQDIFESRLIHGVFDLVISIIKIIIHAVFGGEPVQAWMRFFQYVAEKFVIFL